MTKVPKIVARKLSMAGEGRVRRVHRKTPEAAGIENGQRKVRLDLPVFERFLGRLRREFALKSDAIAVRFVSDEEMARLNGTFRKKPKTTDVLSFPAEERSRPARLQARLDSLRGRFLGDIAISPAVARRNANSFGRTLEQEICILIVHGFLHLVGYDHETDDGEMERVELTVRCRLGLA